MAAYYFMTSNLLVLQYLHTLSPPQTFPTSPGKRPLIQHLALGDTLLGSLLDALFGTDSLTDGVSATAAHLTGGGQKWHALSMASARTGALLDSPGSSFGHGSSLDGQGEGEGGHDGGSLGHMGQNESLNGRGKKGNSRCWRTAF